MDPYSPEISKQFSRPNSKHSREKKSSNLTRRRGSSINHKTKSNPKAGPDEFGYRVSCNSIQSTQRSIGSKRTTEVRDKGTDSSFDTDRRAGTVEETLRATLPIAEKNALNFLKMLSMEDERENPVEKEIDNLISPEELCEPLKIVNKRKKELAMYHKFLQSQEICRADNKKLELRDITSNNINSVQQVSADASKVSSLPQTMINFGKNGSVQQMKDDAPRSRSNDSVSIIGQTKIKSFMAPKQEPIQSPPSPTKLAHLYKLSPRAMKNRKPKEFDRRLKLFCSGDENDDSLSCKSRSITKGDIKTLQSFKIKSRPSSIMPFREQVSFQKDSRRENGIFQSEYRSNPFEDVRKDNQVTTNNSKAEKEVVSKFFSRFLVSKQSGGLPAPSILREYFATNHEYFDMLAKLQQIPTLATMYKQELPKTLQEMPKTLQEMYSKGNLPNTSVFYPTPQNQLSQGKIHYRKQFSPAIQRPIRK